MFPGTKPDAPVTTLPARSETHAKAESVEDEIGALIGIRHGASNEWVVAGSRTATGKPILANDPHLGIERADPLVSRAHRHAGGLGQGRNHTRAARRSARAERLHRLGLHHRRHRRAGPLHRDGRSVRSVEIPDARRPEAVRDARRDDPRQGRRRREADRPGDAARPRPLRRQRRRSAPSPEPGKSQRSPSPASATATRPPKR